MVFDGIGSRESRRQLSSLDDSSASLLHGGDEFTLEPLFISFEDISNRLVVDVSVSNIRELGGGVVAPDDDVLDGLNCDLGSASDLEHGSVMVETSKSAEILLRDLRGELRKSETVGVCGVGYNETAAGRLGDVVESGTLFFEDFGVDLEEFFSLHAFLAREASHKNTNVNVLKDLLGIRAHYDSFQQGIRAVVELHLDAFESLLGWCDLEQVQHDGLVISKDLA